MPPSVSLPLVSGHPLLGSLPDFRHRRFDFQIEVAREHGDVARARFGPFEALIVSSAELAGELLVEHPADFVKSFLLSVFARPLLGDGLLTSEDALHRRQRRLLAPAFVQRRIAGYVEVMAQRAEAAAARMGDAGEVDIGAETMRVTLEIVGEALFDADLSPEASEVGRVITVALECMQRSFTSSLPMPPAIPTPTNLRLRRAVADLNRVVFTMIEQRRRAPEDRGDMLSLLLAARDEEGNPMPARQVRDEAMTAFLAGHETTANALAWALVLLAKHPKVLTRAVAEVDRELGDAPVTLASLERVPLCLRILKEAMRLYPPVYLLGRRALRDVNVGGVPVRKGKVALINIAGIHRRSAYYPDPESFDPDRFLEERERLLPRHAFMPFGAGPRMCIGNHFALLEGQLVLAAWLRRLHFSLAEPGRAIGCESLITLRPRGPVTMRVAPRKGAISAPEVSA